MKYYFKIILVALSIFIQAMLPVGFMPSYADEGFTIEICSGLENKSIQINQDEDHGNFDNQGDCAYFVGASFAPELVTQIADIDVSLLEVKIKIDGVEYYNTFLLSNYTRGPPHISLA